jgi:hypothetical protein
MGSAVRLVDGIAWLGYLSPHWYLGRSDIAGGKLDSLYVSVGIMAALGLTFAGASVHRRNELRS